MSTPKNKKLTASDAVAQSVLKTQEYLRAHEVIDANSCPGQWYTTTTTDIEPFKEFHFVRLIKSVPIYKSTAYIFQQKGYLFAYDFLPTLRCIGFETDGELGTLDRGGNAMYMLAPPDTYQLLQEDKLQKMQQIETAVRQSLGANLRNQPGMQNVQINERPL